MATNVDVAQLDGLFKRVYSSDGVIDLIPENVKLINLVPFQAADKLGDTFRQPVVVANEAG